MKTLRSWLAVSHISFKNTLTYRFNMIFYTIGTIMQLLLMLAVWSALDSQGSLTDELSFSKMVTYSVLAFSLNIAFSVFYIYGYLTDIIRKGDLAMELVRPIDFLVNLLFRYLGFTFFRAGFLAIPFSIISAFVLGIQLPTTPALVAYFALSVVLAYLIHYLIFLLFAFLTFISLDNSGIFLTFLSISSLFSGLYVPFWLFPTWLRNVAEFLPFKAVYFTPISVYMGSLDPLEALAFQGTWLVILVFATILFWRFMMRRVVVQGG